MGGHSEVINSGTWPQAPTVFLLGNIGVEGARGPIDEFICQAFGSGLDALEGSLMGTCAQQAASLIHPAQPVASLLQLVQPGQVLLGTIDDGIHQDLQGILAGEQMDDLKGTLDAHGHELFVGVSLSIIVKLVRCPQQGTTPCRSAWLQSVLHLASFFFTTV